MKEELRLAFRSHWSEEERIRDYEWVEINQLKNVKKGLELKNIKGEFSHGFPPFFIEDMFREWVEKKYERGKTYRVRLLLEIEEL